MNINLNKKTVTKDLLFQYMTDLEIYRMYMDQDITTKGNMKSPLRNDEKPSFGFFIGENHELCFKDFVLGSGDCIKFVQMKFGLTYFEALSKIALDANLQDEFYIKNTFRTNVNTTPYTKTREDIISDLNTHKLRKKSRAWSLQDVSFWNQYAITKDTLLKYNVEPISHVFIGEKIIPADKNAYCFKEFKDGVETYKIYQPSNPNYKWLNNHNESVWQGWEQLPKNGEILIITKSLKDVMSIHDVCGLPAISLQTEAARPKDHIVEQLRARFDTLFLLYDNDYDKDQNWGRQFGNKLADEYGFIQIEIDDVYKSKDFSDLVKNHTAVVAKKYLLNAIKLPF